MAVHDPVADICFLRKRDFVKKELPLHDATFDGIVTSGRRSTLYFTRSTGAGCSVTLLEVDALQINDFREGNIIVLFEITNGEAPNSSIDLERLFPAPHPSAEEAFQAKHAEFLRSKLSAIEAGEFTLVEMQPAFGADLLALCGSVELRDHGNGQ